VGYKRWDMPLARSIERASERTVPGGRSRAGVSERGGECSQRGCECECECECERSAASAHRSGARVSLPALPCASSQQQTPCQVRTAGSQAARRSTRPRPTASPPRNLVPHPVDPISKCGSELIPTHKPESTRSMWHSVLSDCARSMHRSNWNGGPRLQDGYMCM